MLSHIMAHERKIMNHGILSKTQIKEVIISGI